MLIKAIFHRFSPFKALLIALFLAVMIVGVAHAVYQNIKISGDLVEGGGVSDFEISPDGQYAVYRADIRENDTYELFSVRTLGGERVRLSVDLPDECDIGGFLITSDSQQVVYYGEGDSHCVVLNAVPIGGGTSIELNEVSDDYYPTRIMITGDNANVLFVLISSSSPRQSRLYRVPIGGGPQQPISDTYEGIILYEIALDNQSVVYLQDPFPDFGIKQLYRSDMEGEKTLLDVGNIDRATPQISSDSSYVVYRKNTGSRFELFSVPTFGGSVIQLNGDLVDGRYVRSGFKITPDSVYVVYMADETVENMTLLYRAPIHTSGASMPLIFTMVADPEKDVSSFKISRDSQWVVFSGDLLVDNRYDLFSVSINGGTIYRLNKEMIPDGDVKANGYAITPDSRGVVVIMDYFENDVDELFAVNIYGTVGVRLNTELHGERDVKDFKITNNSLGVVYRADQEVNDVINLYAIPITAVIPPIRLNPSLVLDGDVGYLYQITPDDRGVVYIADQDEDEVYELFVTYNFRDPTDIALSSTSVEENEPVNTVVGIFSTSDPDIGDSHTYALVDCDGAEDNRSFNITGNKLRSSEVFDYETKSSYTICVRSADQGGLSFEKTFMITVIDVLEATTIFLPLILN